MNKELRKLIVDVCNLYQKNVFLQYDLANDVIGEMERKCREKFSIAVRYENQRTILREIDDMVKDKKLAYLSEPRNNCLQTPLNLMTHHGWTVPKKVKIEDIDTVVVRRLAEQAPIQQPSNSYIGKLPKGKKIRTWQRLRVAKVLRTRQFGRLQWKTFWVRLEA